MTAYLDALNFPCSSPDEERRLARGLASILADDWRGSALQMLGRWQRVLADTRQRHAWEPLFEKLDVLFQCGKPAALSGPMIGVTLCVRDSDYLADVARLFGGDRSMLARTEWLAVLWNGTFADTGLWMGKTFEPVSRETFTAKCGGDPKTMDAYDPAVARLGRNFFRDAAQRGLLQGLGLPVLTRLWNLRDRPMDVSAPGFEGALRADNLEKEKAIPYVKTGGCFVSHMAPSAVARMNGKKVYHLNYRWPALGPAYPLTRLVDELVQIADGVYLGQLVMATHHFSLGTLRAPVLGERLPGLELGEAYRGRPWKEYGYQHNGYFLMIDAGLAKEAYAEDAFPSLRPRPGEIGHAEPVEGVPAAGANAAPAGARTAPARVEDWAAGWREDEELRRKFTTLCTEPSPRRDDGDPRELLLDGESILQMLQRIQGEIASQARLDDHLRRFEKLNRLFRSGVAPRVVDGMFQGQGRGYNARFDAPEKVHWYGAEEPCSGFDYYHGATLNLHWGFGDTLGEKLGESIPAGLKRRLKEGRFPSALAALLEGDVRGPAVLDAVWATIGRFVFPWGGKSFQRVSGRKLSMLLDESDDLERRYPRRVAELRSHLASRPHYDLVRRNREHAFREGPYAARLKRGAWYHGMPEGDKEYWRRQARDGWVFGTNIEDARILVADAAMRALDMNYAPPLASIEALARSGPTPFVRHGYVFLGAADRTSILPMNGGDRAQKRVFQFHYRFPMIGGPVPIGFCLDEIVEIAEGLFLGQLIYSTALAKPFHSSVDPSDYRYQLFGYFLLLDNDWQRHRRAIGLDVDTPG